MEFNRTKLKVRIYGQEVDLTPPTFGQARDLQKKMAENGDSLELMVEYLKGLGLPEEVLMSMEAQHVNKLVEHLNQPEKKS